MRIDVAEAPARTRRLVADKSELLRILEDQDRGTEFVTDPNATPQKARELMIANGVRPEDNSFSNEIRQMREGR